MSTSDSKLNYRLSPPNKTTKSFDNLNANNGSRTINSSANLKRTNAMTDDECDDVRQTNGKNVNEFPFGDISFRFDELKNGHSTAPTTTMNNNSGNSARMDSDDFNYKMVRSNGNNHCGIEYGIMGNSNGAGLHHQHRNNEMSSSSSNRMPAAIVAMNNAIAQLSAPAHHEYENVDGDDTDTNAYRSIAGKPVHSDAKSTFLGLNSNSSSNKYDATSFVSVETQPRKSYNDDDGEDDAISENVISEDVVEFEPLLDTSETNKVTIATTRTPASAVQYQNVPSNSVCFVANAAKSRPIECSECGKICCDEMYSGSSSKWENERDQYCRCNGINSSPTSTSGGSGGAGGTMSSAGIDSPTCSTSMKSAKPITLDNSTSFRMSQSLSQVTKCFNFIFSSSYEGFACARTHTHTSH